MKKKVAVIFGGISSEHEVSCLSVINVVSGFREEKYDVILIGITKEGAWLQVERGKKHRHPLSGPETAGITYF